MWGFFPPELSEFVKLSILFFFREKFKSTREKNKSVRVKRKVPVIFFHEILPEKLGFVSVKNNKKMRQCMVTSMLEKNFIDLENKLLDPILRGVGSIISQFGVREN